MAKAIAILRRVGKKLMPAGLRAASKRLAAGKYPKAMHRRGLGPFPAQRKLPRGMEWEPPPKGGRLRRGVNRVFEALTAGIPG